MRLSPEGLREALEEALETEAAETVLRHRGEPSALAPAEVLARHDWILSPEIGEARAALFGRGLFSSEEASAFEWHLRRLRRETVLARSRRSLETLRGRRFRGRVLGDALDALALHHDEEAAEALREAAALAAPVLLERRLEADERAGPHARDPDAAPGDLASLAEQHLEATEEAFAETRERVGIDSTLTLAGLMRALRHPEHDAVFAKETRLRRLAGFFPGATRELGARVRASRSTILLGPRPRVVVVRAPDDVRLLMPSLELGLLTELLVAAETGRALMSALASPALPPALRRPTAGTVGRAFGLVVARAVFEPAYARRDERLRGRVGESTRARGQLALLFAERFAAAAVLAEVGRRTSDESRELAGAAVGLELGRDEATLAMLSPSGAASRFRALLAARQLYPAFVERFDEDFLWNPRFEEPLRAAGERGALLGAEAWAREQDVRMR